MLFFQLPRHGAEDSVDQPACRSMALPGFRIPHASIRMEDEMIEVDKGLAGITHHHILFDQIGGDILVEMHSLPVCHYSFSISFPYMVECTFDPGIRRRQYLCRIRQEHVFPIVVVLYSGKPFRAASPVMKG